MGALSAFVSGLLLLLDSWPQPSTYIPIESADVEALLVSLDDIDVLTIEPFSHRKHGFYDALSTAIKLANQQGIRVVAHVTAKSDITKVQASLAARNLDVEIHPHRTDSVWIRDFGPTLYVEGEDRVLFEYVYYDRRPLDDAEPAAVADDLGYPIEKINLLMEGGNLLSNGQGICIVSDTVLNHNFVNDPLREAVKRVKRRLRDVGCHTTHVLESLEGESTGHVDIYMTWASPTDLLVGLLRPDQDEDNHAIMRRNIEKLGYDPRFNIHVVPMPDPYVSGKNTIIRTYLNLLYLNQYVIVPVYESEDPTEALGIIASVTGKGVVTIAGDALVSERGSIHCLTKTIPAQPEGAAAKGLGPAGAAQQDAAAEATEERR